MDTRTAIFYVICRKIDHYYYMKEGTFCSNPVYAHHFESPKLANERIKNITLNSGFTEADFELFKVAAEYTMEPMEETND